MSKKHKRDLKVGNPTEQIKSILSDNKYNIQNSGAGASFFYIKKMTPVFAFDYISLKEEDYCYNSKALDKKDYIGFFKGLNSISRKSYDELSKDSTYHFHQVDFKKNKLSIDIKFYKNAITNLPENLPDEELPTLYQVYLNYNQKARAFGFLYNGIFHLLWFDKEHKIFKSK